MATQGPTTTGATPAGMTSRLTQMQMRFQQRQQQERDQRKVEMISTTTKSTTVASHQNGAGSSSTVRSSAISAYSAATVSSSTGGDLSASLGAGKVRQMFDERRHRVAGIDKSYPLQPIQQQQQQQTPPAKATLANGSNVSNGNGTAGKSSSGSGGTGLNNKTRVPPISANTKARLAAQQQRQQQQENGNHGETLKSAIFDDNENLLDDEKFPDTISFDEELTMTPTPIARKLPNVGKLNGQQQNVNSLKLKPVPGRTPSTTSTTTTVKSAPKKTSPVSSATTAAASAQSSSSSSSAATPRASSQATNSAKSAPSSRASTAKSAMATSATSRKPSAPSPQLPEAPVPDGLVRCTICGRNFAEDRIVKHREICQKTKTKKRKVFDTTKHRVLGTDAEKYVLKKKVGAGASKKSISGSSSTKPAAAAGAAKSDWRRKHEEFIQAIRAAKEMQAHLAKGGKLSDLPPPPPSENPDYIQCPHCSRRFNQTAAERHIPKCANMLHNKPKPTTKAKRF